MVQTRAARRSHAEGGDVEMVDAPLHFCADIDRLERVLRAEKKRFSAIFNSFETILSGMQRQEVADKTSIAPFSLCVQV